MMRDSQNPAGNLYLDDHTLWQAVLDRDRSYDNAFLYGVKSTGICCRPSCPSRRPAGPSSVEFFASLDAAEAAGYRACLRCKPGEQSPGNEALQRVWSACRQIEESIARRAAVPTLDHLAASVGISSPYLQKTFKATLGISPQQYASAVQQRQFAATLRFGEPVGIAARRAGLRSPGSVYSSSGWTAALEPSAYRAGSPGALIQYVIMPCPLGRLLVAATARGVCSIKMGNDDAPLADELRHEFPQAEISPAPDSLAPFILTLLSALAPASPQFPPTDLLPLDIRATAFQQKVWQALRAIPPGETRTYSQIAAEIGHAGAARAVGTACGANPVALAIPCHRAVPASGKISGYRWGPPRKQQLLALEKSDTSKEKRADHN